MSDMKTCSDCGQAKPLDQFSPRKSTKDGLNYKCRECTSLRNREYREANRERLRQYKKEKYEANKDEINAYGRAHYAANSERLKAKQRARHAANKHHQWEHDFRRRSKGYGYTPVIKSFTEHDLIEKYGNACVHCGGPYEELDHHPVPVAFGGEHSLENCRPSCDPCNRAQSADIRYELLMSTGDPARKGRAKPCPECDRIFSAKNMSRHRQRIHGYKEAA